MLLDNEKKSCTIAMGPVTPKEAEKILRTKCKIGLVTWLGSSIKAAYVRDTDSKDIVKVLYLTYDGHDLVVDKAEVIDKRLGIRLDHSWQDDPFLKRDFEKVRHSLGLVA